MLQIGFDYGQKASQTEGLHQIGIWLFGGRSVIGSSIAKAASKVLIFREGVNFCLERNSFKTKHRRKMPYLSFV